MYFTCWALNCFNTGCKISSVFLLFQPNRLAQNLRCVKKNSQIKYSAVKRYWYASKTQGYSLRRSGCGRPQLKEVSDWSTLGWRYAWATTGFGKPGWSWRSLSFFLTFVSLGLAVTFFFSWTSDHHLLHQKIRDLLAVPDAFYLK